MNEGRNFNGGIIWYHLVAWGALAWPGGRFGTNPAIDRIRPFQPKRRFNSTYMDPALSK
jgi:hypothetical protein